MAQIQSPFLWEAILKDGSVIKQDPQDESRLKPKTILEDGTVVGGSSFTDIAQDVDDMNVAKFSLIRRKGILKERWSVDLLTGLFEHDGTSFCVMPNDPLPIDNPTFQLIYFINRRQEFNADFSNKTGKLMKLTPIRELPMQVCIGWQTNIEGKNYYSKILVE